MQNINPLHVTGEDLELFHVQTSRSFELPASASTIHIGKLDGQSHAYINASDLPNADIISRTHVEIEILGNGFYIKDMGSSNGTYVNGAKLEQGKPYPLNLGDRIDLGKGSKVTFIFQHQKNSPATTSLPAIQPQIVTSSHYVSKRSKLVGLGLMVAGVVVLGASTHVGLILNLPGVLLGIAGVACITWRRDYRYIGWILVALGIAVIAFTSHVFASVNLLAIVTASALFIAGYLLFHTGRIGKYDLESFRFLKK